MTWEELNEVRSLNDDLKSAERLLEVLRLSAGVKVPVNDGMPHNSSPTSRVEIMTVRIVDLTREIEELKAKIIATIPVLKAKIKSAVEDKTVRALFILRYVDCMLFRDIGFALGYSEAHIYYLHRITLEKIIEDNSK